MVCVPIGTYLLILLINTIVVLVVLKRRKDYPSPLTVSRSTNAGDLTRLLIASFVLYLIFLLAMFDLDVLVLLNMYHLYHMPLQSRMHQVWYPIALYLLNINYSLNFFAYLLASPNFRRTLRRIFCCERHRERNILTAESTRTILAYPDRALTESPGGSEDLFLRNGVLKPSPHGIRL
ncbi:hypothetical protein BV898_14456 [Hypsibius exemplaris]|uniref:G-protein coupled receptors family 1 profile domain-containing protein n=1 Tax=Hypsibius exemplaris TaxID=2072580 RepID=A0A9X6N8S3_HYPEX|nr:hypothetical protein BV898_14456 [Hypsibius exemplaris]